MSLLLLTAKKKFTPLALFRNSEQGAWYDPSDLTSLFQESTGIAPMSAVGTVADQPVGLMLDKSKGLALGAELVTNGDFSNGTTGWTVSANGSVVSGEAVCVANGRGDIFSQNITTVIGKTYLLSATMRGGGASPYVGFGTLDIAVSAYSPNTIKSGFFTAISTTTQLRFGTPAQNNGLLAYADNISVKEVPGNHAFQATSANRPLLSARVNLLLATATLSTQSVTSQATNYTLAFTGTGTVTLSGTATGTLSAGSNTFTATAGTLTLTVSGSVTLADLRPTNSGALLPPYQRVNTASDYDAVGFPLYLACNGTSSAMSTNSINFTATDKMTVVTGVRKLSDAVNFILENSPAIDGSHGGFAIHTNIIPNVGYLAGCSSSNSGVNWTAINSTIFSSPITNVVSVLYDLSKLSAIDTVTPKINGAVPIKTTAGTSVVAGTFASYPLYLFARVGTSFFLNGNFYGAIIRGAQSDTASVTQTENYMATKTGITF